MITPTPDTPLLRSVQFSAAVRTVPMNPGVISHPHNPTALSRTHTCGNLPTLLCSRGQQCPKKSLAVAVSEIKTVPLMYTRARGATRELAHPYSCMPIVSFLFDCLPGGHGEGGAVRTPSLLVEPFFFTARFPASLCSMHNHDYLVYICLFFRKNDIKICARARELGEVQKRA